MIAAVMTEDTVEEGMAAAAAEEDMTVEVGDMVEEAGDMEEGVDMMMAMVVEDILEVAVEDILEVEDINHSK